MPGLLEDLSDAVCKARELVGVVWPTPPPKPPSWPLGTPTIDIVIPCRDDELVWVAGYADRLSGGLMMTVTSCERLLAGSKYDYHYYIVSNGQTGEQLEAFDRTVEYIKNTGHLGAVVREDVALSPPSARNAGAAAGSGDLIFFFDNHCRVHEGYFRHAIETFESKGADCLHGAIEGMAGTQAWHHYGVTERSLRTRFLPIDPVDLRIVHFPKNPYRIASAGHGSFAIRRSAWQEIDGYWPGFQGWGGEELYLDLKLAMMDKTNYLDPRCAHWHDMTRKRAYKTNTYESLVTYVENFIACANIIGGNKWAEQTAASFKSESGPVWRKKCFWWKDRLDDAVERSEPRRLWFNSVKQRTLDEQLLKFRMEGVAC